MFTICRLRTGAVAYTSSTTSRRLNSSAQPKPSPHIGFYQTFTRPITKVLLMATCTYQMAYWAWVKLEIDETKVLKNAEVDELRKQVAEMSRDVKKD